MSSHETSGMVTSGMVAATRSIFWLDHKNRKLFRCFTKTYRKRHLFRPLPRDGPSTEKRWVLHIQGKSRRQLPWKREIQGIYHLVISRIEFWSVKRVLTSESQCSRSWHFCSRVIPTGRFVLFTPPYKLKHSLYESCACENTIKLNMWHVFVALDCEQSL